MMGSRSMSCMVLCCLLVGIEGTNMVAKFHQNNSLRPEEEPKPGDFVNCGNKSSETWLRWRPRKLRFGDTAKFSFHFIPPLDLKEGQIKISAFMPGQTEPVYYSDSHFDYRDFYRYVKFLKSPFYKNKPVNVINFEKYIAPSTVLPTGEFFLRFNIFTTAGEEVLCLYGHVIMLDD